MDRLPVWVLATVPATIKAALEHRVDSLHALLACWTLLVAIGVMWELGATAAEKSKLKRPLIGSILRLGVSSDTTEPPGKRQRPAVPATKSASAGLDAGYAVGDGLAAYRSITAMPHE
jgi:hypothetical protein